MRSIKRMLTRVSRITKLALSLGFTMSLGFAFTPLGCGGSAGGFGPAVPEQGDAEVPEGVALQLRTCAGAHTDHLGRARHSVSFDVKLANDGQIDAVALRDSTLDDEELEACMASALRLLSEDDLPMRRSDSGPRGPVAPESRMLLGQEEALACLSSPPCLLTVGFLIGAAYITVQIYVHATAREKERCKKVKQECIAYCSDTTLPTPDFGWKFQKCKNDCLERRNCPRDS
jgi:hypothetical protein